MGLGASGLAPKVGGNDRNEELQYGEDGKHGQIAPAYILGTKTHSQGQRRILEQRRKEGPERARKTCPRSHRQPMAELERVSLLPDAYSPLNSRLLLCDPPPTLYYAHP